jgi:hypothetical protein
MAWRPKSCETLRVPSAVRPLATYAELVDDGDFAGVGTLLAEATFTGAANR